MELYGDDHNEPVRSVACRPGVPGAAAKKPGGRIVNVSSESGSLAEMGAGPPAYQVSKAALNALTRTLARELREAGILVNAVCPGWVATDMGGAAAPRSAETNNLADALPPFRHLSNRRRMLD